MFDVPRIFLWIPVPVADTTAVNSNDTKTRLANSVSIFFTKGKPVVGNDPRTPPRNHCNCTILDNCIFDNFILADELFTNALPTFETCLSVKISYVKINHVIRITNHI